MRNLPVPAGPGPARQAPPMTGIVIGAGLSLILWAMIAGAVIAVA